MLADVTDKLTISTRDRLFDVACGIGNLLIPFSFVVQSASGVDHPSYVKALESRYRADNVSLIGGDFLTPSTQEIGSVSNILIYSVLD